MVSMASSTMAFVASSLASHHLVQPRSRSELAVESCATSWQVVAEWTESNIDYERVGRSATHVASE
jgi:hypothetical protein